MNRLNFICALLLLLLLSVALMVSSVQLFFSPDELAEMGVRLEPLEMQIE